jgi:serine phosphatase RsbU (regulator of sigma subunit)
MLEQFPLFSSLPAHELEAVASLAQIRRYPPGTVLFYEGDPSNAFLIILEGNLEVIKDLGSDTEQRLAVLGVGEYLGEMSLFLGQLTRSASARTLSETALVEFSRIEFEALIKRQPEMAFQLMKEMSQRIRSQGDISTRDLRAKNQRLEQAFEELKAAQAQIIEQEKLAYELSMARQIQEALLPEELPVLDGWDLGAYWQPARSVSGDFYDFIMLSDRYLAIVVGDVTDKGVPAALVMAVTRSVIRAIARVACASYGCISPGNLLEQINEVLCPDMPMSMFVTCLLAVLDVETGVLMYASAGHPPLYHCNHNGVSPLRARGIPLGLFSGTSYEELETQIAEGDSLLMFSDGLTEAHDGTDDMFGFERICTTMVQMRQNPTTNAQAIIQGMLEELNRFTGPGVEQEDDVTLVSLRRVASVKQPGAGA